MTLSRARASLFSSCARAFYPKHVTSSVTFLIKSRFHFNYAPRREPIYQGLQLSPLPPPPDISFVIDLCDVIRSGHQLKSLFKRSAEVLTVRIAQRVVIAILYQMIGVLELHTVHVLSDDQERQGMTHDPLKVGEEIADLS